MKRQLKRPVVYALYGVSLFLLVGGILLLGIATKNVTESKYNYVSKGILDYEENIKVVTTDNVIYRPYTDSEVKVVKSYYDYKADAESQEKSLVYYENTYMQSTGISYSKGSEFDVVSILSGTIKEVKTDETLGNSVIIEHSNGIISVYQSIANVTVKEGDEVAQGAKIATTSTSNISPDLQNHLYFELIKDGVCVNPENYFDKSINEL